MKPQYEILYVFVKSHYKYILVLILVENDWQGRQKSFFFYHLVYKNRDRFYTLFVVDFYWYTITILGNHITCNTLNSFGTLQGDVKFYNINVACRNHICITCFFIRDPFIESHIFDGGWSTVATALSFERALDIKKRDILARRSHIINLWLFGPKYNQRA